VATGHTHEEGPWLPIGIGVHTGPVFVGTVSGSEDSVTDITALGDNVNVAARLASLAAPGEALISEVAYAAGGADLGDLERRQLDLKGRNEPVPARVLRVSAA
jgi:adenylate cyclase